MSGDVYVPLMPREHTADGPRSDRYDAVVIGAGMAGLTAGALLARAGRSVLVIEAQDRPGGHCRNLVSGGYAFDPAIHFVLGGGTSGAGAGLITGVLSMIGAGDACELFPVDPFYEARFPDLTVRVGSSREGFVGALAEHFPDEEAGLWALVELGDRILEEFMRLPVELRASDLLRAPLRFRNLMRYRNATVAEVADRHLRDRRLKALYMSLFPYIGLPPSRASFLSWATMMASFLGEGVFYCRGGFQNLADAFQQGLEAQGGELVVGRRVQRIRVEEGRAAAVELDDGQPIRARDVVATCDARHTFGFLLGDQRLPRHWRRRLERREVSITVLEMYLGTDLDVGSLGVTHETVVYPTWDLDAAVDSTLAGGSGSVLVTIPTLIEPAIAPEGHHQVVVAWTAPDPAIEADPVRVASGFLQAAEQVVPELSHHVVHVTGPDGEPTTRMPPTLHRISDIYGWADGAGARRPPQATPIEGLTLAGHWTEPGHGVWTVIASGVRAARMLTGENTHEGLTPLTR